MPFERAGMWNHCLFEIVTTDRVNKSYETSLGLDSIVMKYCWEAASFLLILCQLLNSFQRHTLRNFSQCVKSLYVFEYLRKWVTWIIASHVRSRQVTVQANSVNITYNVLLWISRCTVICFDAKIVMKCYRFTSKLILNTFQGLILIFFPVNFFTSCWNFRLQLIWVESLSDMMAVSLPMITLPVCWKSW